MPHPIKTPQFHQLTFGTTTCQGNVHPFPNPHLTYVISSPSVRPFTQEMLSFRNVALYRLTFGAITQENVPLLANISFFLDFLFDHLNMKCLVYTIKSVILLQVAVGTATR